MLPVAMDCSTVATQKTQHSYFHYQLIFPDNVGYCWATGMSGNRGKVRLIRIYFTYMGLATVQDNSRFKAVDLVR